MKKLVSLMMVLIMTAMLFAGCGQQEAEESSATSGIAVADERNYAEEAFSKVEPLDEKAALSIGLLAGGTHGFQEYLIGKLGGWDKANIDPNIIAFGNGPIMVESVASDAWDCGVYGLGGTLSGTLGHDVLNLGAASKDYHALMVFTKPDHEIVQAGANFEEHPELYGTAETWKDKEVFIPVGTTLHYAFSKALSIMGLTDNDVKMTHMDVTNVNTALRAGKADIGAVWGNFCYGDLNEEFVPVVKAEDVGVRLVTVFAANPRSYEDAEKNEAIKKWMELYFDANKWLYANEDNFDQAVEWYLEWNEENGVKSTADEIVNYLTYNGTYTLEENYEMFNTPSADGTMNQLEEYNYLPLEFFIENGNYKPEDADKLMGGYFLDDFVEQLYKERND